MTDIYQVDAFTDRLFGGNPAAVVPFPHWPADELLQAIASENNLAETAYIVPCDKHWEIRWFTPTAEVALCGHATLAAAHVVFQHLNSTEETLTFETRESGTLKVSRLADDRLSMSFPAVALTQLHKSDEIAAALGTMPVSLWKGYYSETQFDYVAVFSSADEVAALQPNEALFGALGSRGIIATSAASDCDFVSRYFAPAFGIPEDPVTGSAHCLLTPFWAKQLNKNTLAARQISARGGVLECQTLNDRVVLIGRTVDYMKGRLALTD